MTMSSIFNSPFETSLRILLIMEQSTDSFYSSDMLAAIDFVSVYGKDFGIADTNLHGDNLFMFSEFATRRSLTQKAIKESVLSGLLNIKTGNSGFEYQINETGLKYCCSLESDYANSYREVVRRTIAIIDNMSEQQVLKNINEQSISSLRKGGK